MSSKTENYAGSRTTSIMWPKDGNTRSTTSTNKAIWIAACEEKDPSLAKAIDSEKKWREKYQEYLFELGKIQFSSEENAVVMAQKGLDALYSTFTVGSDTGTEVPLREFIDTFQPQKLISSKVIKGSKAISEARYDKVNEEEIKKYVVNDQCEPDVLSTVVQFDAESSLAKMRKEVFFVILGATSELCPLTILLQAGFTVIGISRPKKSQQDALIEFAEGTTGTLILPQKQMCDTTGADLITDFMDVAEWLKDIHSSSSFLSGMKMVIGSYIYLDGSLNVQACLGMDVVVSELINFHKENGHPQKIGITYLTSPGVPLPVSTAAAEKSAMNYTKETQSWGNMCLSASLGPFRQNPIFKLNNGVFLLNGLMNFQGHSYALSKTLQVWRCIIAKNVDQVFVSCAICPPSSTDSVIHAKTAAIAMRGMKAKFPPYTAYEPKDAKQIMTEILLADLAETENLAKIREIIPFAMLTKNSVHGGIWREGYGLESISAASYFFGMFR